MEDGGRQYPAPAVLRLFVTGGMPGGQRALRNLAGLTRALGDVGFQIETVDIPQRPEEAAAAGIVMTPTLSDESVSPPRRMTGDFSDIAEIVEFFGGSRKTENR